MPTVNVYNIEGQQVGEMTLDEKIFGVEVNPVVVQEMSLAQRANAHIPYAHTKGRADVRGGGKKPWKQKGTGRARHGSIRSPLWRGGGVTFGPLSIRNMAQKMNKKQRRKAIRMMLSDKAKENLLIVIESFDGVEGKTKQISHLLEVLPVKGKSALIASAEKNELLTRSTQNLEKINTVLADSVNVADLLQYRFLVVDKSGIEKITSHFAAV